MNSDVPPRSARSATMGVMLVGALMFSVGAGFFLRDGMHARRLATVGVHAKGTLLGAGFDKSRCSICVRIDEGPARTASTCVDARVACKGRIGDSVDMLYDPTDPGSIGEAQLAWQRGDVWWVMAAGAFTLAALCLFGFLGARRMRPDLEA